MANIDVILSWPDCIDFPLFRKFLHENRSKFKKIIIVWTETNWSQPLVIDKVEADLANEKITFLRNDPVVGSGDWRDVAVNKALKESKSEWVYFTEQDFTPKNGFWREVGDLSKRTGVFGWFQDDRLHPCCLFIKRELLDRTHKDFSANPSAGYDHFGRIQKDLEKDNAFGIIFKQYGEHLNGLTHNLYLYQKGEQPVYKPEEFFAYLAKVKEYEP